MSGPLHIRNHQSFPERPRRTGFLRPVLVRSFGLRFSGLSLCTPSHQQDTKIEASCPILSQWCLMISPHITYMYIILMISSQWIPREILPCRRHGFDLIFWDEIMYYCSPNRVDVGWVRLRGVLVRQLSHPKTRPHRSSISVDLVLICQIFFFNFFYMIILAIKKTYICPHNKWNPVKVISKIEFYELKKILHWDKFPLINNSINFS